MRNIHILPTDKPSRLHLWEDKLELCDIEYSHTRNTQHIYITSDEEIKIDDYYLGNDNHIYCLVTTVNSNGKKLILTTDEELIAEGVQAIDDKFLDWFVKNPTCEGVEYNKNYNRGNGKDYYKIIIPKEPKLIHQQIIDAVGGEDRFRKICKIELKQDPLEEAAKEYSERHLDVSGNLGKYLVKAVFQDGGKWEQEQDKNKYSEEEVLEFANWCRIQDNKYPNRVTTTQQLLEQFKKK